jgi:tripartite-type tricarboxylate transporter receptor subunit TctC
MRLRPNDSRAAFAAYVEAEVARWSAVIRELGISFG